MELDWALKCESHFGAQKEKAKKKEEEKKKGVSKGEQLLKHTTPALGESSGASADQCHMKQ